MKPRFFFLVLLLVACSSEEKPLPQPDNILLIVVDTLRADRLGCYGYQRSTSPAVDRLAAEGLVFDQYYTVVPTTLASFTSLLTSRHPKDHGAYRNGIQGDLTLSRLSELFSGAGFETAAFIASYCLSAEFGMNRGFRHFDEEYTQSTILNDNSLIRSGDHVTRSFIEWAENRDRSQPFFTLLHYFDPHWPYAPPDEHLANFGAYRRKDNDSNESAFIAAREALEASDGQPDAFAMNQHNLYCGEIRFTDQQVDQVMTFLKRSGMLENTLVIFTADHGETFWDNEHYFNHGMGVYETTTRIPLIFRWPGVIQGARRSDLLLCNLDLAPTLCRIAGITPPASFHGIDFSRLLWQEPGEEWADRAIFSEATKPVREEQAAVRPNHRKAKSVRLGAWKLIQYPYAPEKNALFNIQEDPMEKHNLYGQAEQAKRVDTMMALLKEWANTYPAGSGGGEGLDAEAKKKLGELGY